MKFDITPASLKHGFIAVLIGSTCFALGLALNNFVVIPAVILFFFGGFLFYLGREIRDLEKLYNWDIKKWNSAELLVPLFYCVVLAGAMVWDQLL